MKSEGQQADLSLLPIVMTVWRGYYLRLVGYTTGIVCSLLVYSILQVCFAHLSQLSGICCLDHTLLVSQHQPKKIVMSETNISSCPGVEFMQQPNTVRANSGHGFS